MKFEEEQLFLRRPIWIAFSELFLDNNVTCSYEYIAQVCAESPFTLEELEKILRDEVAPVVSGNLSCITGEWIGFDEEWLIGSIQKNNSTKVNPFWHFFLKPKKNLLMYEYISEHWDRIIPKIVERRENS